MSFNTTYLKFEDTISNSHKFYEVTVNGTEVTIRFGRIGEQGQTQSKEYATSDQAQREADKKIREKVKKGYLPGTLPSQSPTASSPLPSTSSVLASRSIFPTTVQKLPIVWKFNSGTQAFGLFVSSEYCWIGNQQGRVFRLDLEGQIINQYQLPAGVKCIVEDDIWIYVGCDNGNVYDLTGKLIYLAYEIESKTDILWLDIHDGVLGVADASGSLVKIDPEGDVEWTRFSSGKMAWMVRGDDRGFYHGHSSGVTLYDRQMGRQLWHQPTEGKVLFGWQADTVVYAGTSGKRIIALDKESGAILHEYHCDTSVYSCATAEDGHYLFAGDSASAIYCFNRQGQRLWKGLTGCGSALSMQIWGNHLYVTTTEGTLACIDVPSLGIHLASENSPRLAPLSATDIATITQTTQGAIVECVLQQGKLRIRPVSPNYHADWKVQFPTDLREEGARYWVQELRVARQGDFYRAYGEIQKLE
ncbi:MAG: WGR domain-containing protein [Leptolyngbyaceae cyanobacterium bins.59]|nr:WGR domain-containing protein [Leptolyngbyaceae cyanobacterium bins.59]